MKKLFALPLFLLLMLLSLPAFAEMTTLGKFYVDVPANWIASEHDGGFSLTSPDGKCAAGVTIRNTTERDSLSFASTMSKLMGGTVPRKVPGSSAFVFLADMHGTPRPKMWCTCLTGRCCCSPSAGKVSNTWSS